MVFRVYEISTSDGASRKLVFQRDEAMRLLLKDLKAAPKGITGICQTLHHTIELNELAESPWYEDLAIPGERPQRILFRLEEGALKLIDEEGF